MITVNQKNRRLPGFRFEAAAPARADVLPRMDVALFVGFASKGPVGIPVAVETAQQFEKIFGGDLPLVWNAKKGEMLFAQLAPTVRAFFRNGGRRCWILRVARLHEDRADARNRAVYNFFPVFGCACLNFDGGEIKSVSPLIARARSHGSWSDDLRVGAAVLSKTFEVLSFVDGDDEKIVTLETSAAETISRGDLFRFSFPEASLLLTADDIKTDRENQSPPAPNGAAFGKRIVRFGARRFVWLQKPTAEILPGKSYKVQVRLWNSQKRRRLENFPEQPSLKRFAGLTLENSSAGDAASKVKLKFSYLAPGEIPAVGTLLTTKLKTRLICLQVEAVLDGDAEKPEKPEIICRAVSLRRKSERPAEPARAERLTFELRLENADRSLTKLSDLAFNDGPTGFWGNLPTDEERYRFSDDRREKFAALTENADAANFPLAGSGNREGFYFPLFTLSSPEYYLGPVALAGTKLQRDGLAKFDEDLFLDANLKNTGAGNLLNEAEFIRYLSARPRRLNGIHAALVPETVARIVAESQPANPDYSNYSLDECTIVAVPDAVHAGWSAGEATSEIIPPPIFSPPERADWRRFEDCRRRSPIAKVSQPPRENFLDCGIRVIEPPENLRVHGALAAGGKFTLVWKSTATGKGAEFVLEESNSPEFDFPKEVYRGKERRFIAERRAAGVYFYRVRAEIGKNFSDWSKGFAVRLAPAENWTVKTEFSPDVLLAVQRALLRMCAARGDLFAVLNLPEHFDEREAFAHVGTLRATKGAAAATAGVEPFSADELQALSFGAAFHPWLVTRDEGFEKLRNIPPDGAIVGTFAARAALRGAWIAPANEILRGVLGLAKDVGRELFLDFQDNSINLVRHEPRGFLVLDSATLSEETDWRSINVRRLLSQLRRLAVKHGAEYVFEPNTEAFRRQVERGFSALLDLMFTRGAFAGSKPADAFQVVVGAIDNRRSLEQGRLIVELRVAPSLPLKFVTVRLVNAGGRTAVTEVF